MSYNGNTDCNNGTCLDGLVFNDLVCPDFNQLIAEFNARTDALAAALCCVAGTIPEPSPSIQFIPLTTVHADTLEDLVDTNLPYTTNVAIPGGIPAGYNGLILRVYFELDNRNNVSSTIQLSLNINDQAIGTVEHGGQNVTDDSFWNGDFFVPPNPADPNVIKINPEIDFNTPNGDPTGDVYAVLVKVVGYF